MKLLIVAFNYPSKYQPTRGIFVQKLADEMQRKGIEVSVIAPVAIGLNFFKLIRTYFQYRNSFSDNPNIIVYRPLFLSMSNLSILGVSISLLFFKRSVMRCYLAMNKNFIPDFTYGHFLSPSGEAAIDIAALCNAKSFVALGEDNLFDYDKTMLHKRAHEASGFISVSSKNTQYMLQQSGISQDKILHAPNSVSTESFFPRKKSLMREKLNLSKDDFILAFVGFFEERKGLNRVMKAIENLPHNVKIIIIGEGPQQPDLSNERILFCGKVSHTQLPEYLSASDAFILPTLSEGSCNAIVEAMACGLPIISSAIPEIQDQVPDTAGILVDPNNIENITNAIFQLYHNKEMRDKMAIAAENVVKNYTISHRVSKIIQFMTSK